MVKRAFVTGIAGFVGSAVARRLLELNWKVYGIDNLATGYLQNVPSGSIFRPVASESQDAGDFLEEIKPDVIFHIGGQSSGEIGESRPVQDIQSNATSTLNLLNRANKVGCTRFLYASSMGVYGSGQDNQVMQENGRLEPISIYGTGKLAAESYLRLFAGRGMNCIAFRMFNIYGPGQNLENSLQGMVSIFLKQVIDNNKVTVRGSLSRTRDFIYIDDVVNAWITAAEKARLPPFAAINLGSGKGHSVEDLLTEMQKIFGPFPIEVVGSTPADQSWAVASIIKANEILDWAPQVSLARGLDYFSSWCQRKP